MPNGRGNNPYTRTSQDRNAFKVTRAAASFTQNAVTGTIEAGEVVEVEITTGSGSVEVRDNPTGAFPIDMYASANIFQWYLTQDGGWTLNVDANVDGTMKFWVF